MYTLLILVSVFALQGMPTTMPRPSEPEAAAQECGRGCPVIPVEGLDSEFPAEVATSLADAAWTSAQR